jgi:hypothetical protein
MNDDERLQQLLRSALPSSADRRGANDLWPSVVERLQQRPGWTWIDMAVAALVATALLLFPESVFVLSYHL